MADTLPARSGGRKRRASEPSEDDRLQELDMGVITGELYKEINNLIKKVEEYDEYLGRKDEEIEDLKTKIEELEEEVRMLKQQLETSEKELQENYKSKNKKLKTRFKELEIKFKGLQGDHNIYCIVEMCRKLQENIYRYVFPDTINISSKASYKIKNLDENIEKINELTEQERRVAKKRWEELKEELNPGKFYDIIDGIHQELRNASAYLEIGNKEIEASEVFKAAKELHEDGTFLFIASLEDVNELIGIWKTTEELVKKM